ncbi:MAG: thermonuclease family protein [Methylophaga sp.]|nr:thermonuclease family protein [Methylophaga sp.]
MTNKHRLIVQRCLLHMTMLAALLFSLAVAATTVYRTEDTTGRISFSDTASQDAEEVQLSAHSQRYRVTVKRVIDGDTVVLDDDRRVRLLGINTPEIANRYRDAEPGGEAAKQWLEQRLADGVMFIEYDQTQLDQYGRLLAYCYNESGEMLNEGLLRDGMAMMTILPPNMRHSEVFTELEQAAQRQQLGIWAMPEYQRNSVQIFKQSPPPRGWQRLLVRPVEIVEQRQSVLLRVNDHFALRIADEHLPLFDDLNNYLNQDWQVQGWLSRRQQSFFMQLRHPSALTPP